jgi:poly(hydroxyalkanoate) depolymerase family esterase
MNPLFAGLMKEAAHLTRNGRLADATAAIQRALRQGTDLQPAAPDVPVLSSPAADVIDIEARVVDVETAKPTGPHTAEQWTKGSFTHQGRTVDYKLFVPAGGASQSAMPRPLIVMLHGCTQDPEDFAAGTRMNEHARECGALVLYPEQAQRANGQKCWNWFKAQHQQRGRGEPAVLAALTLDIAVRYQADRSRIYVAGLSAGGAMAHVLGNCYPDIFAAVGVHSGLPHRAANDMMSALSAMRAGASAPLPDPGSVSPPVIVFHGDADTTVHASNGIAILAGARPCEAIEGRTPGGTRYTRTLYAASPGRGDAEHWRVHGLGHAWSGGSTQGSYTAPHGVDASGEMIRFFLTHRLGPLAQ